MERLCLECREPLIGHRLRKRCPDCATQINRDRSRARARSADYRLGSNAWRVSVVNNVMSRARKLKVQCDPVAVARLLRNMPERCPVLGVKFEVVRGRPGASDATPTVDRIDPAGGYVEGNIVVISWLANRIKSNATPQQVSAVAAWYSNLAA